MRKVQLVAIFLFFANISFTFCGIPLMQNASLFEGDVTEINYDVFEKFDVAPDDAQSAAGGKRSRRWPRGTIYYEFASNYPRNARRQVLDAIRYFMRTVPCIRIVPRRPNNRNFVRIINGNGCFAPIGMRDGRQELSLQVPGCLQRGIVVHEFLHSLGVFHEQSRPDRDEFVTIMTDNIDPNLLSNFEKYSTNEIFTDTQYDYGSVMHYGRNAFSTNGQDTVVPKQDNVEIGQREGLSRTDVIGIQRLYGCRGRRAGNDQYRDNAIIWEYEKEKGYVWHSGCDFKTKSYKDIMTNLDDCVKSCIGSKRCTHFTYNQKTSKCSLRDKKFKRKDAIKVETRELICGYPYECEDQDENCETWVKDGRCKTNQNFMYITCCKSCRNKQK